MPFTRDHLAKLDEAIALGARKVKYSDKEVEYNTLSEMLTLRRQMETKLNLRKGGVTFSYAEYKSDRHQ